MNNTILFGIFTISDIINFFVAFGTIALAGVAIITIFSQKKETNRQQTINNFYTLLDVHHDIVENITFPDNNFYGSISKITEHNHPNYIDPFCRSMKNIIDFYFMFLKDKDTKYFYKNIVISLLSEEEEKLYRKGLILKMLTEKDEERLNSIIFGRIELIKIETPVIISFGKINDITDFKY